MALPTEASVHALTDPDGNGNGIRILRTVQDGTTTSYYVAGNVLGRGRCGWVDVTTTDTAAHHNTAIRAALGV